MPFFDDLSLGDPQAQGALGYLSGMSSGFAAGAMPSRAPIPFGATLGNAAALANQGAQEGAQRAQAIQKSNVDLQSSKIGLDQALIMENMTRRALGLPPLSSKDLQGSGKGMASSPLFGMPTIQPGADDATDSKDAAAASGASAPASNSASPAPAAPASAPTAPGAGASPLDSPLGKVIVNRMFGIQPTDYEKAKLYADSLSDGPDKVEAQRAASKLAGIDISPQERSQGMQLLWDPTSQSYKVVAKNPSVPEGYTVDDTGTKAVPMQGGPEAVSDISAREAGGKALYKPMTIYDNGGNEYTVPESMLQGGKPPAGFSTTKPGAAPAPSATQPGPTIGTKVSPFAQRVASIESSGNPSASNPQPGQTSAGLDGFNNATWLAQAQKYLPPQLIQGKTDQQILAMRTDPNVSSFMTDNYARDNAAQLTQAGIKNVSAGELYLAHHFGAQGAASILKAPVNAPLSQILPPQVLQANPDLQNATVGDVYSHANQAMKGVTYGGNASAPAPSPAVSSAAPAPQGATPAPNTPVANSQLNIPTKLPDFIAQLGPNYQPPTRPGAPEGALMGEPGKGLEEIQKADGDRLEQYSKEAAGGQKIYTNLQQLYQIMGRGLSTGNMTGEATHLTNLAQQAGLSSLVPKNFDPNDSGAFNKLATDLVFAQLKQIGGRPMVSEIEGLKQANPNTSLTPAANVEILNNILADQRWRDSRADLGRQYMAKYGSLGDFDARFNEKYPEVDAFNKISGAAAQAGWKLPGAPGTPSGGPGPKVDPKVQAMMTSEAIAHTAQTHNTTVEKVKADMRAAGYQVP